MLTTTSRLRIQEILTRLSMGKQVTLEERIYINKYATNNQDVSIWLRKASRIQRKEQIRNEIDELLNALDLNSDEPHVTYDPDHDDLGEWFSGAPSWIRRS
jgi:two-component SAPR family response regulator